MSSKVLSRVIAIFCISLLAFSTVACDEEEATEEEATEEGAETDEEAEADEEEEEQAEAALPEETTVLELDEDESEIPATIEVPVNVNTFSDAPTSFRIEYGDQGELFSIQIQEATEYDTNLEFIWDNLDQDEHELIELNDELLRYVRPDDTFGRTSNRFILLTELDGQSWRCSQGTYGGYSEEQIDRQIEACQTLTAK